MKKITSFAVMSVFVFFAAILLSACGGAVKPVNSSLNEAQLLVDSAKQKIIDAQKVNNYELGGHAQNAKDLLSKASQEITLAAQFNGTGSADNSGGGAVEKPVQNISKQKHPNLAEAQDLIAQAFQKISDAQQANGFNYGGHAKNAKELLAKASEELKLAAETANEKNK